jgi:hypothetical protein
MIETRKRMGALPLVCLSSAVTAFLWGAVRNDNGLASALGDTQLAQTIGGTCANQGCINQVCYSTGCSGPTPEVCTYNSSSNKCVKAMFSNFARCGAQTGYNCTEASLSGCVKFIMGDPMPAGECPESACTSPGSNCGDTRYACTATSCPGD